MIVRDGDARTIDALWPNLQDKPLSDQGIYKRITNVTHKHLGLQISSHLIRDIAATYIAETAPDQALMAAHVLQHRDFQTTKDKLHT